MIAEEEVGSYLLECLKQHLRNRQANTLITQKTERTIIQLLLVNNVLYLVTGRQYGILSCNWPIQYKYIENKIKKKK